jgi:hypothetical protein
MAKGKRRRIGPALPFKSHSLRPEPAANRLLNDGSLLLESDWGNTFCGDALLTGLFFKVMVNQSDKVNGPSGD